MSHDSAIVDWPAELPAPLLGRRHQHIPRGLGTQMDSGRIRMRREFTAALELVGAEWNFTLDQFETFKLFFENTLQNGSLPFEIRVLASTGSDPDVLEDSDMTVAFWNGRYSFSRSDNLYSVSATLELKEVTAFSRAWDYSLCGTIDLDDGGGDTFDCYPDGELPESLDQEPNGFELVALTGGKGLDDEWIYGDSPYGYPLGDDFNSYADGNAGAGMNAGTGLDDEWIIGPELSTPPPETEPVVQGDFRYIRLLISANNGSADSIGVLEFEMREEFGGANVVSGGTATASAFTTGFGPEKSFDGSFASGDGWIHQNISSGITFPQWIQYDFGVGNTVRLKQYRVGSYSSTVVTVPRSAKDWKLQGSNNGSDWTDLHEVTEASNWTFGEMRTYGFPA